MPSASMLVIFLGTAVVLAIMPGPGLLYIAGRTLGAGRQDGIASCVGTALGGSVHVLAGAVGVSALVMASAEAFFLLKTVGGIYLIYLGVQAWRSAGMNIQANILQNDRNPWKASDRAQSLKLQTPRQPRSSLLFFLSYRRFVPDHLAVHGVGLDFDHCEHHKRFARRLDRIEAKRTSAEENGIGGAPPEGISSFTGRFRSLASLFNTTGLIVYLKNRCS